MTIEFKWSVWAELQSFIHFLQAKGNSAADNQWKMCRINRRNNMSDEISKLKSINVFCGRQSTSLAFYTTADLPRVWRRGMRSEVIAERYCPCKQPACPAIGGGSEVTFKPLVPKLSVREGFLALTSLAGQRKVVQGDEGLSAPGSGKGRRRPLAGSPTPFIVLPLTQPTSAPALPSPRGNHCSPSSRNPEHTPYCPTCFNIVIVNISAALPDPLNPLAGYGFDNSSVSQSSEQSSFRKPCS
ncbi:hypothetical protein J6590_090278 [Homalodisca vitripennis]|nr:hypothetical protein J6590_090278 [Homalodisca vitripennis]